MLSKKKLKREDFLFENAWFENKAKKPGELQMQQFQISDCQECNIFLFDSCACVYIDQCKYCTIFIGACQSSVFVRDSHHLTVICATQQFRVRQCNNCFFSIFCESQPIIESSYDIKFSNFMEGVGYVEMEKQMQECKINGWNNHWYDVYDFTPQKYPEKINFMFKSIPSGQQKLISELARETMKTYSINFVNSTPIPRCLGVVNSQMKMNEIAIIVIYPPIKASSVSLTFLQSKVTGLSVEQQSNLEIEVEGDKKSSVCVRRVMLFVKIMKSELVNFSLHIKVIEKIVKDDPKLIEIYENTIFMPFKDEH